MIRPLYYLDRPLIELPAAIADLRGEEFLGANITVPFKERVVPMVDRLTEEAAGSIIRIERYRAPLSVNREPLSQSCILAS